jgi:hypothetical protein
MPDVALVELPPEGQRVSIGSEGCRMTGDTKEGILVEDEDVSSSLENGMGSAQPGQTTANYRVSASSTSTKRWRRGAMTRRHTNNDLGHPMSGSWLRECDGERRWVEAMDKGTGTGLCEECECFVRGAGDAAEYICSGRLWRERSTEKRGPQISWRTSDSLGHEPRAHVIS